MKVNAFLKTLAERLAVEGHVEPNRLANKLAATLEKMEAKTIGGRLRDVVTGPADTVPEVRVRMVAKD